MKEKLTKNLGMKILSLAIAFVIWIVIINIDDPVITKTFSQISVDIKNENAINSQNKVYKIVTGDEVNITVKGKRSVVDSLKSSDFKATADLEKLSSVFSVPIEPSIMKSISNEVELSLGKVDTLIVKLEDVVEKQFKVTIVETGNVEDGYSIGDIKVTPNLIRVSGAKSQISTIDQVRVELDVSNAFDTIEDMLKPVLYNAGGEVIDSSNMRFSSNNIKVTADLVKTKTVPLIIKTIGKPDSAYKYVSTDYEPKKIIIAGKQQVLNKIKNIPINIDITDKKENIEEEINLAEYLPNNVQLVSDNQTAMVNIKIEKLINRNISLYPNDINVRNLNGNMSYSYVKVSPVTVTVRGTSTEINKITMIDLKPFINLSNLREGKHKVSINFDYAGDVIIINKPSVEIELTNSTNSNTNLDTTNDNEVTNESSDKTNNQTDSNTNNKNNSGQQTDTNGSKVDQNKTSDTSPSPTASSISKQ